MTPVEEWQLLTTLNTEGEANLLKGLLESMDIPCLLESRVFNQEPVTLGTLGRVLVRVPRERHAEAVALLAEQLRSAASLELVGDADPGDDPRD